MVRLVRHPDRAITIFVIVWLVVFGYESFRLHYLSPLARHPLPKVKLLFPPAGWIMFYAVDASYGFGEVYGVKDRQTTPLDPHQIFRTHAIGYDNIRRNVLVGVLNSAYGPTFCRYLRWKFPQYTAFIVLEEAFPDVVLTPTRRLGRVAYTCQP